MSYLILSLAVPYVVDMGVDRRGGVAPVAEPAPTVGSPTPFVTP